MAQKPLLKRIFLFLGVISQSKKSCLYAGLLAKRLGGIVDIIYIEDSVSFAQWQLLGEDAHQELHHDAETKIHLLGETISTMSGRPPVLHYIEPQSVTNTNSKIEELIANEGKDSLAYFVAGANHNDDRMGELLDFLLTLSKSLAPLILIPESMEDKRIVSLFA